MCQGFQRRAGYRLAGGSQSGRAITTDAFTKQTVSTSPRPCRIRPGNTLNKHICCESSSSPSATLPLSVITGHSELEHKSPGAQKCVSNVKGSFRNSNARDVADLMIVASVREALWGLNFGDAFCEW